MEKIELAQDIASIIGSSANDSEALWEVIKLIQKKYLVVDTHHLTKHNPYNYMNQSDWLSQNIREFLKERQEEK